MEFAISIVEGERNISQKPLFDEEKEWIKKGLAPILTEKLSFSFDSFTTFRLKSFYQSLEKYVLQAIDEYKLEQDYQNFIATLRDFLQNRDPKMSYLHLVYRDAFHFYDHSFRRLERSEITEMIDRHLLSKEFDLYRFSYTCSSIIYCTRTAFYLYG